MITTLDSIKAHLNIDKEYQEDDELLIMYAQASEDAIEKHINCKLNNMMNDEGYVPASVQSAILLMIGNLYANRESVAIGNAVKIPYSMEYLINLNKNYNTKF